MPYLPLLLSLLAVDLIAAMSPGPNFVLVSQSAVQRSRLNALAVVSGLVFSNLIWCVAVVLGLATLFTLQPWLYEAIRILGGVYLIYFGIQLWCTRGDLAVEDTIRFDSGISKPFVLGVLTNLANPKAAIYFGSIFTLFMKPGTPVWVQGLAIAIVLADTILWYGFVAVLLSSARMRRFFEALRRPIDRVAGTLMVAFGARLLWTRES